MLPELPGQPPSLCDAMARLLLQERQEAGARVAYIAAPTAGRFIGPVLHS